MANQYMSMDNLRFLLRDVHNVNDLLSKPRFKDFDMESIDIMLDAAKDLADQELYPYFREMDEQPAYYKEGKVIAHPKLGQILKALAENGWIASSFNYEHGGAQMPKMVYGAANHIFESANNHVPGYIGLTTGAAGLIKSFGSQELIDTYLPNMINGKWMGTMALTEPQAGSSLSDITTSATPTEEGHYKIKGQKIFISGGDHQFGENFVHLTLARIEGAPAGTKGISLFVVPKHRINENGSLSPNDVITAGDFQKMGQRGYTTTHLVFGENDDCQGWLVGEPHRGLKYMFQMMNSARIDVGMTAASTATAAYYASLQYANERPQGRMVNNSGEKDISAGQTLIINHPDVRRMLLLQKAVIEGSLSLLMECTRLEDIVETSEGEEKGNNHALLELLTPIAKTYPSEMGRLSISNGLQILGGYGFCSEFVLQQYYRDIRIMALYEGTTGIQSIDLLGRKVTMMKGKALQHLVESMQATIQEALTFDELKPYAKIFTEKLGASKRVLDYLLGYTQKGEFQNFLADATIFMEFFSTLVIAWQWLKISVHAKKAMLTGNNDFTDEFYESKVHTMKFYFKYELPKMEGLGQTLMNPELLTLKSEKELIV